MVSAVILFMRSFRDQCHVVIRPSCYFHCQKCNNSVSFSFLFPCFLFSSSGTNANSFFLIKGNCCIFELSVPSVFISLRD